MDHSEDLPIRCQLVNKSPRKVLDYISTWGKAEIVYLFRKTDMRKDSDMQSPVCENFSYIFGGYYVHSIFEIWSTPDFNFPLAKFQIWSTPDFHFLQVKLQNLEYSRFSFFESKVSKSGVLQIFIFPSRVAKSGVLQILEILKIWSTPDLKFC